MAEEAGNFFAPAPGQMVFTYKEVERPGGGPLRTISFTNIDVVPLDYELLVSARGQAELTIPLDMRNAQIVDTDVEDVDASLFAHIKANLTTTFTANAIGLVRGGWVPSALGAVRPETLVILDRNVVTEIMGRFYGGVLRGRAPDFLDMFGEAPVQINPCLYAMEGNRRALPDVQHVRDQLEEAISKLSKALPRAHLLVSDQSIHGIIGLLEESREEFEKRQAFLMRVAPMLESPVARSRVESVWAQVVNAASCCGVPSQALVVLAALSVVVTPRAGPARELLKFKRGYDEALAYNALCDIRAIEYLLYLHGHFPNQPVQLCTGDLGLAKFWVALGADMVRENGELSIVMTPHPELIGGEDLERWNAIQT